MYWLCDVLVVIDRPSRPQVARHERGIVHGADIPPRPGPTTSRTTTKSARERGADHHSQIMDEGLRPVRGSTELFVLFLPIQTNRQTLHEP